MAFAPIFIIGIPRSGTTLLRVLLDSHSQIAGLPETPWLLGAYGANTSLRSLLSGLIEGSYGAVRNLADIARSMCSQRVSQKPLAAIVLDYGFLGAQIGPLSQLGIPIILGTHNLESAVTSQVVKGSLAAIGAVRLRRAVEFAHERLFFREADAVLCVAEEDRMATRTPVITTSKGCEGIGHAGAFQVADDAASFREGILCAR